MREAHRHGVLPLEQIRRAQALLRDEVEHVDFWPRAAQRFDPAREDPRRGRGAHGVCGLRRDLLIVLRGETPESGHLLRFAVFVSKGTNVAAPGENDRADGRASSSLR